VTATVRSIACTDIAVEARYLGACLMRPEALEQAPVPIADLASRQHQAILAALLAIRGRTEDVTTLALRIELERQGQLRAVGEDRLLALTNTLELDPHACARRIRELATLRRTRDAALRGASLAEAGDIGEARRELASVALEDGDDEDPVLTFRQMLTASAEALAESRGAHRFVTMGTPSIDAVFRAGPGDLVVVGAATNTGKSTMLMTWAVSLARRAIPVGIVSIEDNAEDFGAKGLTAISGVPSEALWSGGVSPEQLDEILRGIDAEGDLPISFARIRSRGIDGVVSRMAYMARVRGCRVICVDYLQAIRGGKGKDAREKINDALSQLMAAAGMLGVTLVLASQLRRSEGSKHHEPHDGELKESGDIENSAQCIVLLWRETDDDRDPRYGVVYGKVAKVKRAAAGRRFWLMRERRSGLYVEQNGPAPSRVDASDPRSGWVRRGPIR
jgi:replicative DNA helicase